MPVVRWFVVLDKRKAGSYGLAQMQQLAAAGRLRLTDMVLQDGTQKWVPASSFPNLAPLWAAGPSERSVSSSLLPIPPGLATVAPLAQVAAEGNKTSPWYRARQDRPFTAHGLGIASLVLGCVALPVSLIPYLGVVSLPLSGLGFLLGVGALIIAITRRSHGVRLPVAGSVMSVLAFAVGMFWPGLIGGTSSTVDEAAQKNETSQVAVADGKRGQLKGSTPAGEHGQAKAPPQKQSTPAGSSSPAEKPGSTETTKEGLPTAPTAPDNTSRPHPGRLGFDKSRGYGPGAPNNTPLAGSRVTASPQLPPVPAALDNTPQQGPNDPPLPFTEPGVPPGVAHAGKPVLKVSGYEMYFAFVDNPVAATQKYEGKLLQIEGCRFWKSEVAKDDEAGKYVVWVNFYEQAGRSPKPLTPHGLMLRFKNPEGIAALKRPGRININEVFSVRGTFIGYVPSGGEDPAGRPFLIIGVGDCKIVEHKAR